MEEFRELPEYPGYQIGNQGNIISPRGEILKPILVTTGYHRITLNYKHGPKSIHRLVALAWIANPENKKCVHHLNYIRTDNRLCNLQWATHCENNQDTKLGMRGISWSKSRSAWRVNKQINYINYDKTFQHRSDAELYLKQISTITI